MLNDAELGVSLTRNVDRGSRHGELAPRRSDSRDTFVAGLAAAGAAIGGMFGGLDTSFGGPIVGICASAILITTIALTRPSRMFWQRILPSFVLLALAWIWALFTSQGAFGAPALVPDLAFPRLLGLGGAGAMFVVGGITGYDGRTRRRTIELLVACSAIIALIGLIASWADMTLSETMWQPGQVGRFAGTFGNANVAGTFYAAASLLGLGPWLNSKSRRATGTVRRTLRALACTILIIACLATASRAAVVTLIIGVLTPLIVDYGRRPELRLRALSIGGVAIIVIGLALLQYADTLIFRFGNFGTDVQLRLLIWDHYAAIAAKSPWFGHGIGSFETLNSRYLATPEQAAILWPINAAHNVLIGMIIEAGLPFALLIVASATWIIARAVRSIARGAAAPSLTWVLLAGAIIAANAMVDIALDIPSMVVLFWFLLGLLFGGSFGSSV